MSRRRLFIDPATISSGWALFKDDQLVSSGTIAAPAKLSVWERTPILAKKYKQLGEELGILDAVHCEKVMQTRFVQKAVHWSVGVILTALSPYADVLDDGVPIASWQSYCKWPKGVDHGALHRDWAPHFKKESLLYEYCNDVDSADRLAAIGMGLWYTGRLPRL